MRVRVRACDRVRVCAYVRACVCASARAFVCVLVSDPLGAMVYFVICFNDIPLSYSLVLDLHKVEQYIIAEISIYV